MDSISQAIIPTFTLPQFLQGIVGYIDLTIIDAVLALWLSTVIIKFCIKKGWIKYD